MYLVDDLIMRTIEAADLEDLREMHNHPSTLQMLKDTTFVTHAMQVDWFKGLGAGANRNYVITDNQLIVAMIRMYNIDLINSNCEVGIDVMTHLRGQGYGTRCMELVLEYCFQEIGFHMVYLSTAGFNLKAQRLYEKLGFRECGRMPESIRRGGSMHDTVYFALMSVDWLLERVTSQHPDA